MTYMKHLTLRNLAGCLLISGLLLTVSSCSQEEVRTAPASEGRMSLSVTLPIDMSTRSADDALNVNTLHWSVFEVKTVSDGADDGKTVTNEIVTAQKIENFTGTADLAFPLVSGKQYRVALCAINSANDFVTYYPETGKLSVDYSKAECNVFTDDVFTGVSDVIDIPEGGSYTTEITLTRPFAQLNWGTSDLNEPTVEPYCQGTTATVTISQGSLFTDYDLFTGEVSGEVGLPITFPTVNCDELPEVDFPMNGVVLPKLVAMNYLLTAKGNSTISASLKFEGNLNEEIPVDNAAVEANYRTNIYGNMLTNSGDITITLSRAFNSADKTVPITVGSALELVNALKNKESNIEIPEGTTIDLTDRGSFDLVDGQTITIEGTLLLGTLQLQIKSTDDKKATVTIDGNGKGKIICTNSSECISPKKDTKLIMKNIEYNSLNMSGYALASSGDLDLYKVTLNIRNYGITTNNSVFQTINLEECVINYANSSNYALCLSNTTSIIKNCQISSYSANASISIGHGSTCEIYGGIYSSHKSETLAIQSNTDRLTIYDGDFVSYSKSPCIRIYSNNWNPYLILKGGRYSGNIATNISIYDLPADDGLHVEEITDNSIFKYKIVEDGE